MSWCLCPWRTPMEYDHMGDDKGRCKHCGSKIKYFFVRGV